MKNYLGFGIIFALFLTSCASVRTIEIDQEQVPAYRNAVVYGIYDGDGIKTIRKYTEELVDKMEEEGVRVKLVTKELEKHGLRRNPPILNKEDETTTKLDRAMREVQAEVLLITSIKVKGEEFGLQVVVLDADSQKEVWKGMCYVSPSFITRGLNAKAGAKNTLEEMQKYGFF